MCNDSTEKKFPNENSIKFPSFIFGYHVDTIKAAAVFSSFFRSIPVRDKNMI